MPKVLTINHKTLNKPPLPVGEGLMAHLVLGYPSLPESVRTAEKYIAAGIQILELQIPFSHPTADGPVITLACQEAVRQGVSVQDCIETIRDLRERFPEQEIMVMSYLNRIFKYGIERFIETLNDLNINHLIVPDLPVDSPLALQFIQRVQSHNLRNNLQNYLRLPPSGGAGGGFGGCLVPVLAANIPDERLAKLLSLNFDFFYLMSGFKITGSGFSLHPKLKEIVRKIRSAKPQARIGIGFGISTAEQAHLVLEEADVAIIGSALIQAQLEGRLDAFLEKFKNINLNSRT